MSIARFRHKLTPSFSESPWPDPTLLQQGLSTVAPATEDELLRPSQISERLQIQERTVTRWLRNGYLRGFKLGKEWRVSSADLRSFMEKHANKPLDETA
jgi:excisionase family DNA binding protein